MVAEISGFIIARCRLDDPVDGRREVFVGRPDRAVQVGTLCPHLLVRDGLGAVDRVQLAGQLGDAPDQVGTRRGDHEGEDRLSFLVPGLDTEPLDVALDHEPPQKLYERQNPSRAGNDDIILNMRLFFPCRKRSC